MPIGETYPQSVTKNNLAHPDASEPILEPEEQRFGLRSTARAVGTGVVALGASLGLTPGASAEQPLRADQPVIGQLFKLQDVRNSKLIELQRKKEVARCKAQKEQDQYQYTSCEYKGAYVSIVKKFPKWSASHHLDEPGHEDITDRRKTYFKTHPAMYKRYSLEIAAGLNYESPREWVWDRVNQNECSDTWDCNTGNGYYGGLQMDRGFQQTYNMVAYRLWGTADNWPKEAQEKAADRAYDGYEGYGARGLGPWPSSNAELGTFPTSVYARLR